MSARPRIAVAQPDAPAPTPAAARAAVRGGIVGNYVDQFDIFLPVMALAPAAGQMFGSAHAAANAGLIFAATLLGRPLGACVFGPLADRVGRARITRVALLGVVLTTLGIAFVPGARSIGGWALAWVLALRFAGGIFLGGQYTAAVPLAMEWSPPQRRGLVSGVLMAMSPGANASSAGLTFVLYAALGADAYADWGWRVIFVLGALLAACMYRHYARCVVDRRPGVQAAPAHGGVLRGLVAGTGGRRFAAAFVLMSGLWLMTNMAVVVLTGALQMQAGLPPATVTLVMLCATAASAPAMVLLGHASGRLGRGRCFVVFGAVSALAAPALYLALFSSTDVRAILLLACALQWVTVAGYGPVGAHLAEQFPAHLRSSGYGLGYSLSIVLPALFPYYLPLLQRACGEATAVAMLLTLGAALVTGGGAMAQRGLLALER